MDVCLNNPEIQAKIDCWLTETGRGPDELIEDAVPRTSKSQPNPGDAQ